MSTNTDMQNTEKGEMTSETFVNLMRAQNKRKNQAIKSGNWKAVGEAITEINRIQEAVCNHE